MNLLSFLNELSESKGVIFGLIIVVIVYYIIQQKRHCLPYWPFMGMLPSLLLGARAGIHEWFTTILRDHNGTFMLKGPWLSNLHWVVTCNPINIEHLLKTKFSNFPKGGHFRGIMGDLFGEGIFNSDGHEWAKQRKAVSTEFQAKKFRTVTTESVYHLVHKCLLPLFEDLTENHIVVDLQDILLRFALENICMVGFGFSFGSLEIGLPSVPFLKAFDDATDSTLLRFFAPVFLWKVMRFLNIGWEKSLKRSIKVLDDITGAEMNVQMEKLKSGDAMFASGIPTTFIAMKDDDGNPYTEKFLRDNVMGLVLAGRDASAVAMTWFFWLLHQHPEVEAKILEEVRGIVGDWKSQSNPVFGLDDIKKMEYLHAALSESLRLYPSGPHELKEVAEDDVFPDGTPLRKGMFIYYSVYAMGRLESIWGKDCREYKPERWLKDGKFVNESPYKFAAFNGGPRVCLGRDFAYYQMKYVSASVIYRYQLKVVKDHPVVPKLSFTLAMKYGLKVELTKRS